MSDAANANLVKELRQIQKDIAEIRADVAILNRRLASLVTNMESISMKVIMLRGQVNTVKQALKA